MFHEVWPRLLDSKIHFILSFLEHRLIVKTYHIHKTSRPGSVQRASSHILCIVEEGMACRRSVKFKLHAGVDLTLTSASLRHGRLEVDHYDSYTP